MFFNEFSTFISTEASEILKLQILLFAKIVMATKDTDLWRIT
jgi:hypothetical protein